MRNHGAIILPEFRKIGIENTAEMQAADKFLELVKQMPAKTKRDILWPLTFKSNVMLGLEQYRLTQLEKNVLALDVGMLDSSFGHNVRFFIREQKNYPIKRIYM